MPVFCFGAAEFVVFFLAIAAVLLLLGFDVCWLCLFGLAFFVVMIVMFLFACFLLLSLLAWWLFACASFCRCLCLSGIILGVLCTSGCVWVPCMSWLAALWFHHVCLCVCHLFLSCFSSLSVS